MTGCAPEGGDDPGPPATAIANPAAAFCVESGGTYAIRRAADGSETGTCILTDGTEVDAWAWFREQVGAGPAGGPSGGQ